MHPKQLFWKQYVIVVMGGVPNLKISSIFTSWAFWVMTTNRFLGFISFELVKSHWEGVWVDSFPPVLARARCSVQSNSGKSKVYRNLPYKNCKSILVVFRGIAHPGTEPWEIDPIWRDSHIFFKRGLVKNPHQLGMFWVLTFRECSKLASHFGRITTWVSLRCL